MPGLFYGKKKQPPVNSLLTNLPPHTFADNPYPVQGRPEFEKVESIISKMEIENIRKSARVKFEGDKKEIQEKARRDGEAEVQKEWNKSVQENFISDSLKGGVILKIKYTDEEKNIKEFQYGNIDFLKEELIVSPENKVLNFLLSFFGPEEVITTREFKNEAEKIYNDFTARRSPIDIDKISEIKNNPLSIWTFLDFANMLTIALMMISGSIEKINFFTEKKENEGKIKRFLTQELKTELDINWFKKIPSEGLDENVKNWINEQREIVKKFINKEGILSYFAKTNDDRVTIAKKLYQEPFNELLKILQNSNAILIPVKKEDEDLYKMKKAGNVPGLKYDIENELLNLQVEKAKDFLGFEINEDNNLFEKLVIKTRPRISKIPKNSNPVVNMLKQEKGIEFNFDIYTKETDESETDESDSDESQPNVPLTSPSKVDPTIINPDENDKYFSLLNEFNQLKKENSSLREKVTNLNTNPPSTLNVPVPQTATSSLLYNYIYFFLVAAGIIGGITLGSLMNWQISDELYLTKTSLNTIKDNLTLAEKNLNVSKNDIMTYTNQLNFTQEKLNESQALVNSLSTNISFIEEKLPETYQNISTHALQSYTLSKICNVSNNDSLCLSVKHAIAQDYVLNKPIFEVMNLLELKVREVTDNNIFLRGKVAEFSLVEKQNNFLNNTNEDLLKKLGIKGDEANKASTALSAIRTKYNEIRNKINETETKLTDAQADADFYKKSTYASTLGGLMAIAIGVLARARNFGPAPGV